MDEEPSIHIYESKFSFREDYIGKTCCTLKKRLQEHLCKKSDDRCYRYNWLQKLVKDGIQPIIIPIIVVDLTPILTIEDQRAFMSRIEICAIAQFRACGLANKNTTSGGEGMDSETASKHFLNVCKNLGAEGLSKRARKAIETLGPEGLKARAAKAIATLGAVGIAARMRKIDQMLGIEGRRARALKREENMGKTGRSARALKIAKTLGPEGCRNRVLKGCKTLGKVGLAERARRGDQNMSEGDRLKRNNRIITAAKQRTPERNAAMIATRLANSGKIIPMGIVFDKNSQKYRAYILISEQTNDNAKIKHLGRFLTIEEAMEARATYFHNKS
jgi:hypothetical protein